MVTELTLGLSSVHLSVCVMVHVLPLSVAAVSFDPVSYDVSEGDMVTLTLKIDIRTSVTVTVETIPGTAGENGCAMAPTNVHQ